MKNPFLVGQKIYLRGLTERDLDPSGPYFQWFNDQEVCQHTYHGRFPNTEARMRAYFDELSRSSTKLVLAIITKDGDRHIGNVSLQNIYWIERHAEFAILLGDKDHWGKGYAKEVGDLLLHHAFQELNLKRVHCGTTEENVGMQKLALYLGMKEEGRRRAATFRHGKYLDFLEYGVLREEFAARKKAN